MIVPSIKLTLIANINPLNLLSVTDCQNLIFLQAHFCYMEIHYLYGFFILTLEIFRRKNIRVLFLQENAHVLILNRVQKYNIEKYVKTRSILTW